MFKLKTHLLLLVVVSIILAIQSASAQTTSEKPVIRTLLVFFDGLRPDYITKENMPNVYAFKQEGSYGNRHHSVFPTVTRVNASSYATGSYPKTHGLMGNTVYFPEVNKTKGLNTGEAKELMKIADATHNHLLTAISLGELLQQNGSKMMVFSSGSTGQALLQNHKVSGGAIINPSLILPESIKANILNEIGPIPESSKYSPAKHKWVTDALIKYGLTLDGPMVSAIWFSDPDGTAHSDGIGSATAMASIKHVDEQFGRIIQYLKSTGLDKNFNVIISTDHGFITDIGKESLAGFLIKEGLKKDETSDDVVLAGGAIYVKDHDNELIRKIVSTLQQQEWVGAIFTKSIKKGDTKGSIEGTLSFDAIHWDHPERAADILVDANWNNEKNSAGYAGSSFSRGVAGHGGFSPYEVHIPLIASGPSFKKRYESDLPTSNVDLVPTVLYLQKLSIPDNMDGRVIYELLEEHSSASILDKTETRTIETQASYPWGTYKLILHQSILGNYFYDDFTTVTRTPKN